MKEGFGNVCKVSSLCMSNVATYLLTGRIITTTLAMTRNEGSSSLTTKLTKASISCWIEVAFGDNKGSK